MKLSQLILGPIETNTYFLADEETGAGLIVDPAIESDSIFQAVETMGIRDLQYILLTHGHFDHILGVNSVKQRFPDAVIVISAEDDAMLKNPEISLAEDHNLKIDPISADRLVRDGDLLPFAGNTIKVLATPGHTAGSIIYLLDDIMFAGDTVFRASYGRTDLATGSPEQMMQSLYKIGQLPGDYNILPGHGPLTTLEFEKKHDRFMSEQQ